MQRPSTKRKRPAGILKSHGEAEAERLAVAALTALGMPGDLESLAKIRKGQQEKSSYRGPVEGTNGGRKFLDCTTVGNGASWICEPSGSRLRHEPKPNHGTGKTEENVEMRHLIPFTDI